MEDKILEIGKVILDLSRYPGEDKYCDGDIEDTLLEIARERSSVEFQGIIEESKSWPILYHLSPLRENIVEWLPINKNMKVLEVGSGCGAITGALSRKAGRVTCCDLSLKRSKINAYRHMECDNVTIHVGNFTDVEADLDRDYDFICLIGVFEYAKGYMGTEDPYGDFLKLLKTHIKPGGNIAIAIENKFGLKYWAGCKEDHLGTYFSSIENYKQGGVVRTFTDKGLMDIVKRCGFGQYRMYYPYPDYKFMVDLYSDKRLPHKGECKNNLRNMDRDRMQLFNEKDAFDSIIDEGLFHLYSNSYMMIIGPDPGVDYVRYSNDRMDKYCICTEISNNTVKKRALSDEAKNHLAAYMENYKKLSDRYNGSKLNINKALLSADGSEITLEYVKGDSLEKLLDAKLETGDIDGFANLFKEYLERISFGENETRVTDLDLIFSNIIVDGDKWTVIDYEWVVDENRSARDVGFRAIYCYVLEDEKRDKLSLDIIMNILGVTENIAVDLREDEMIFQKNVTGNHKSLGEIREAIGNKVYKLDELIDENKGSLETLKMRPQIYEDLGQGFSEEQSAIYDTFPLEVEIPFGRKNLRIDPCSTSCIVSIKELSWNGESFSRGKFKFSCNGKRVGQDVYVFDTEDPQFTVSLKGMSETNTNKLIVNMRVTPIDIETAQKM